MYHRGGDRGWHQRPQRDIFPTRNHQPRGGYHDHREHNNYGQYNHNACHDSQFMEYEEPTYQNYHEESRPYQEESRPYQEESRPYQEESRPYQEESRPYHDHRDPRDQAYHMRGRHDGGYKKDFRGRYHQNHEESGQYLSRSQRKKYPYKSFKPHMKESDARMKTSTAKPVQSEVHNPTHSVTLAGGSSKNPSESRIVPSQDKNLAPEIAKAAQQEAKAVPEGTIPKDHKKPTQDETKSVQNGAKATDDEAKPAQVSAEPLIEDTNIFSENKKPSEECLKPLDKGANAAKEVVKVELVETNTEMSRHSGETACGTKQGTTEMTTRISCKIECLGDTKKDIQKQPVIEEKKDFSITGNKKTEETFLEKGRSQTQDQLFANKTEIPLLGAWVDMPSDSAEAAGTSTKTHPEPFVDYGLSHTAQELRKAFILAKKEEIESAFSQDCRTFAVVASTLLKKDPSLEVAVSNALRSTLQDIAGHCVQELSKFIDHYDSIPVNVSERLQNADI